MNRSKVLEQLLSKLWADYRARVSYAERYCQLVTQRGGDVVNDHIAFRSLNTPVLPQPPGRIAMVQLFEALGYERKDEYAFCETNLVALHLEHPEPDFPKLFISQLEVDALPPATAEAIRMAVATGSDSFRYPTELIERIGAGELADSDVADAVEQLAAIFVRPWNPPLRSTVELANQHSQYAAWTLLHGNLPNHFTAWVNKQNVSQWPDIESTMKGLQEAGIPVKDTIEGEPGGLLRQSATHAVRGLFDVTESDGSIGQIDWTYAYYEIAERGYLENDSGESRMFSGFFGQQTMGLFEMTRVS